MIKKTFTLFLFLISIHIQAQGEMGFDIGQPINPLTGEINPGTDTSMISATCTPWVRVNFILGPWSSPLDSSLYGGRTWLQAYNEIINGFVAKGIQVYALIGAEAYSYPAGTLEQYPGADSAASVVWLNQYTYNFIQIVDEFKDRVHVFESYNEPNNWTNSSTAIVHPAWFALMLQNIYLNAKLFNGHDVDTAWQQVTLVSGALFTFDLNTGGSYINDTYWYGKNVFAWDWTFAQTGSYPLDGFGQHIYVEQGSSDPAIIGIAMNTNLDDFWNNIYVYETDLNKKIWLSEFGWESNAYGEIFQSDNLTTGFDILQNDARIGLAIWFTLSDFPGGIWGLYNMGTYLPSERKEAYNTFITRLNCLEATHVINNSAQNEITLVNTNQQYFLETNFSHSVMLKISITNLCGQQIKIFEYLQLAAGTNKIAIDLNDMKQESQGLFILNIAAENIYKNYKIFIH